MTVAELIERLREHPPDADIMILDGFNAGGFPRTINGGPSGRSISEEDRDGAADCEDLPVGQEVVVLYFGSY